MTNEQIDVLCLHNQVLFLEMKFKGEIVFVGRENVKKHASKNEQNLLLFGGEFKT